MLKIALADDVATKWVAEHARACEAGTHWERIIGSERLSARPRFNQG